MTLVLVISTNLLNDTLHKALGKCFEVLPWTERFDESTFVKKCLGGIAPNRLEADGAGMRKFPEAWSRLHNCRDSLLGNQRDKPRLAPSWPLTITTMSMVKTPTTSLTGASTSHLPLSHLTFALFDSEPTVRQPDLVPDRSQNLVVVLRIHPRGLYHTPVPNRQAPTRACGNDYCPLHLR